MLDVRGISHWYGDRQVLRDVSFTVTGGHLTGFVGANGAGKTTTMRAILGLIRPTQGEVLFEGRPITDTDRTRFGYMPEERGLYPKMKVREQVIYFAQLHGLDKVTAAKRADELLERVGLGERANDNVEALSLGNQQRAQICVSLVHEPEFLILDEPFSGLDPIAVDVVLGVLQEQAARGVPVLFSSHQLDVVERLSDELVIIGDGEIKATGSRVGLQEQHSRGLFRIAIDEDAWLLSRGDVTEVSREGDDLLFRIDADADADTDDTDARGQEILREAVARGPVRRFNHELVRLSTIFKEIR
ncbi:ABC transporter ATP-binding protein [Gulosibacter molinativorax]|uniref:ABC transporter ATP-binding protein n=1 Tax=Gulosibacter molinativorax TaxID=256821 RepID=A0ABT7C846_9MICO|nr:ATP-binding cassette domain-containing protein [Gulosibacter molinativorax]MDJ1371364.1 ABC transporter ATP-binding protein [Gulosibacter molinativorax]QUY62861.1 ABC-type transporter ATP-binding protein EcsA [Gulosibacter molinativorax]